MTIYDALLARKHELVGRLAGAAELQRLAEILEPLHVPEILRIYLDFPICGLTVEFVARNGQAISPDPDFGQIDDDDVREQEHGFYWHSPSTIAEDLTLSSTFGVVLRAGYAPVGLCVYGGDGYRISARERDSSTYRLVQIYRDSVETDPEEVPEDAITPVAASFADVIRVARFEPPAC
jgi:hypothetical protein